MSITNLIMKEIGLALDEIELLDYSSLAPYFHTRDFFDHIKKIARKIAVDTCKKDNAQKDLDTLVAGRNAPIIVFPPSVLKAITIKNIPKTFGSEEEREALLLQLRRDYLDNVILKKTATLTAITKDVLKHVDPNHISCQDLALNGISFYIHEIRRMFINSFVDVNHALPMNYCSYVDWPRDHNIQGRIVPSNIIHENMPRLQSLDLGTIPLNNIFLTETSTTTMTWFINCKIQKYLMEFRTKANADSLKKAKKLAAFQEAQANNNNPADINNKDYKALLKKMENLKLKVDKLQKGNGHGRQSTGKPGGQKQRSKGKGKGKPKKH